MPNENDFMSEEELESGIASGKIQPVDDAPPITPLGAPPQPNPNAYTSGPLPPSFNAKSPALVGTGFPASTGAIGLMDIQGGPQANAKIETITRTVIAGGGTNSGGEVLTVQVNGAATPVQDLINFLSGPNISISSDGGGGITFGASSQSTAINGTVAPGSTVNFNGVTPPAPGGSTNVLFQTDGASPTSNVSAYVTLPTFETNGTPNATQSVLNVVQGTGITAVNSGGTVTISSTVSGPTLETNGTPNASQALLNLVSGANVTVTNTGGGNVSISASLTGGAAVGADAYCPANPVFTGSTTTLANKSIIALLPATFLKNGGNSIKIGMQGTGGATIQIGQMSFYECAAGSTTVLSTTGVNIGGNSTPIVNFPGTIYTDSIAVVIDPTHDYYFGVYITSGALLASTGTTQTSTNGWPFASQTFTGNNLSLTTVPSMTGTATLIWSAVIVS